MNSIDRNVNIFHNNREAKRPMSKKNDIVNDFYLYIMLIKLVFIFNAYLYIQCIFIKYFVFARQWSYFSEATTSISALLRFIV